MGEIRTSEAHWQTIGHERARGFLQCSLTANRLAHAFIITGPPQVGRMSLAMDIARAANCEIRPNGPCGRCDNCARITRGVHADVVVIDAQTPIRGVANTKASTEEDDRVRTSISIDHVRELKHDSVLNPYEGRSRVFILDVDEKMSVISSRSLMKTLEEPGDNVLIILVARSTKVFPETIASRCQVIALSQVPTETIAASLVAREKCSNDEAIILGRLARGRPGWAFTAASDPTALSHYKQAVMRITDVIGYRLDEKFQYARELAAEFRRNQTAVFDELDLWQTWWRDILLIKNGLREAVVHTEWHNILEVTGRQVQNTDVARVIRAIGWTKNVLVENALPQLALEVLMLELPRVSGETPTRI